MRKRSGPNWAPYVLPWLDVTTAVCNCSRFPAVGSVVVNVDSDAYGFVDGILGGPDVSKQLELEEEDESEHRAECLLFSGHLLTAQKVSRSDMLLVIIHRRS